MENYLVKMGFVNRMPFLN